MAGDRGEIQDGTKGKKKRISTSSAKASIAEEKYIVSFSGGKDSTAMLLGLLEHNYPIDEILFFDTGWEFPEMHLHINKVEKYIGKNITRLHPEKSFTPYWLYEHPVISKKTKEVRFYGCGWPSITRRWCTRIKVDTINQWVKKKYPKPIKIKTYLGYALDEFHRKTKTVKNNPQVLNVFPLLDYAEIKMTERQALQYCYARGFDWGGLYKIFRRVSCFCCPLQRLQDLQNLRTFFPSLWEQMLEWDSKIITNSGFGGGGKENTLHHFEKRFSKKEALQNKRKGFFYPKNKEEGENGSGEKKD